MTKQGKSNDGQKWTGNFHFPNQFDFMGERDRNAESKFERTAVIFNQTERSFSIEEGNERLEYFEPQYVFFNPQVQPIDRIESYYDPQKKESTKVLAGHSDSVLGFCISTDGNKVVSGSRDTTIKIWDLEETAVQTLRGHADSVLAVAISPDGKRIVSGSRDTTVRLWDLDRGEATILSGHSDSVLAVALAADGSRLVSGDSDGTFKIWDLGSRRVKTLKGCEGWVLGMFLSPEGTNPSAITSNQTDGSFEVWDLESRKVSSFSGHSSIVFDVHMTPNGRRMVSASHDRTVRLWDLETKQSYTLTGHSGWVLGVFTTTDGTRVVSSSHDKTIRVWNMMTDKVKTIEVDASFVHGIGISPHGNRVVARANHNMLKVWDLEQEEQIRLKQEIARAAGGIIISVAAGKVIIDDVEIPSGKGGQYVPEIELELTERTKQHLKNILEEITLNHNVLLVGEAGIGKTSLLLYLARLCDCECRVLSLHEQTDPKDLLVRQTFGEAEEGKTGWADSALIEAMRKGQWIVLDEVNMPPPGVLASLNSILQFREITLTSGERLKAHPEFRLFATMNPPTYAGTQETNLAFLDRFATFTIDYLPKEDELSILRRYGPDIDEEILERLIFAANDLRKAYAAGQLLRPFSIRALIQCTQYLQKYPQRNIVQAVNRYYQMGFLDAEAQQVVEKTLKEYGYYGE